GFQLRTAGAVLTTAGGGTGTVGGAQASFSAQTVAGTLSSTYSKPTDAQLQTTIGASAASAINFSLAGTTHQIWDLGYTGTFTGNVAVTLHFDPTLLTGVNLSNLIIEHYQSGAWVLPTSQSIDSVANTITFTTTSFSPFALAVVPEPSTLCLLCLGIGGLLTA